ncbi:uncharacterized protein TNCV_4102951 [Trichonephila clavipes]|nr:uncharacterized protein TNCV_4102951 [Trichonephila clavipes]
MDDVSIYAKSLCEELEIPFEPPRQIRDRVTVEIRGRFQQLQKIPQNMLFLRSEVILSMVELNLDQAPEDINKEEFQFERVRLQAFVACKKIVPAASTLERLVTEEERWEIPGPPSDGSLSKFVGTMKYCTVNSMVRKAAANDRRKN